MKTIIVLQGGGALGAFACGAWKTLVPLPRDSGSQTAAIGGASVGAINAAVIARHHAAPDAGALESLWRDRLVTPSLPWPFSPPAQAHGEVQSWTSPARIDALIAQGERAALAPDRTHPANNETRPA